MGEEKPQKNLFEDNAATAWIDGASSGNPGPSGCGVIIKKDGQILGRWRKHLGKTTNNVAEYMGLIVALEKARELGLKALVVKTDSELLYRQMTGIYKVKTPHIKDLYEKVQELRKGFSYLRVYHIPREKNSEADKLARQAKKE